MPVGAAVAGAAGTIGGAAISSSGARSAASTQRQAAQDQAASQERIAREQMQFMNKMYGEQQAQSYPRQRAANSALAQVNAMLGLGDIYAAPQAGSLGGGQEFYPGAPVQGTYQQPGNAPSGAYSGMTGAPSFSQYVQANPDLLAEYNAFGSRPGGYGFGPNLPASYDQNGNDRVDMDEYGRFHYGRYGQGEGRELPEGLFF
jgi:hypothetical protein